MYKYWSFESSMAEEGEGERDGDRTSARSDKSEKLHERQVKKHTKRDKTRERTCSYGMATVSRLIEIMGLFCKRAL